MSEESGGLTPVEDEDQAAMRAIRDRLRKTAPDRIYLNVGPDIEEETDFKDLDEVTWCKDEIDSYDVPYIRADLALNGEASSPPTPSSPPPNLQRIVADVMLEYLPEDDYEDDLMPLARTVLQAIAESGITFAPAPEPPGKALSPALPLYEELLLAVESKFPGETRHETALRYIRERERNGDPRVGQVPRSLPDPSPNAGEEKCLKS